MGNRLVRVYRQFHRGGSKFGTIYFCFLFFLIHFQHTSYISGYFKVCVRFSVATSLHDAFLLSNHIDHNVLMTHQLMRGSEFGPSPLCLVLPSLPVF